MRNYNLPRGPCNFLNLRISPWEILLLLPLCFSSLSGVLLAPLLHRRHLYLGGFPPCLPASAQLQAAARTLAGGRPVGPVGEALQAAAQTWAGEPGPRDRRRCVGARAWEQPRRGGSAWARAGAALGGGPARVKHQEVAERAQGWWR
jgi:hypothetical protein